MATNVCGGNKHKPSALKKDKQIRNLSWHGHTTHFGNHGEISKNATTTCHGQKWTTQVFSCACIRQSLVVDSQSSYSFQHVWCWPPFLGMNLIVLPTPFIIVHHCSSWYIVYTYIYACTVKGWSLKANMLRRCCLFILVGAGWLGMVWGIDLSTQLTLGWSGTCSHSEKTCSRNLNNTCYFFCNIWLYCLV